VRLDASDEPLYMVRKISSLIHIDRVTVSKPGERGRQVGLAWHRGAVDEHWDHGETPLERCFNLDSNKVFRVVDSPRCIDFPRPTWSDHGNNHVAPAKSRVDVFPKVVTERYGINVHEDGVAAEMRTKTVVDPSGNAGRILPPI